MLAGVLKKRLGFPENLEGLTNAWCNAQDDLIALYENVGSDECLVEL